MRPAACTTLPLCVRTQGQDRRRYVCCGEQREEILGGNHPRVAAVALCERLYGPSGYSLHEHNPWQYTVAILVMPSAAASPGGRTSTDAPASVSRPPAVACTPASPAQKPEVSHP